MKTDDLLKRQSEVASVMRWALTFLVVISHCIVLKELVPVRDFASGEGIFQAVQLLIRRLGTISVCCFGYISGYYFFNKVDAFNSTFYFSSLKKRVSSLLIPYLLWNILAIVGLWSKNTLVLHLGFAPPIYSEVELDFLRSHSWLELFLMPVNSPMWYIRDLIYLVLLSPLVYFLVSFKRGIGALALLVFFFTWRTGPMTIHLYAYFLMGAFFAVQGGSILSWARCWSGLWIILALAHVPVTLLREDLIGYAYLMSVCQLGVVMLLFRAHDVLVASRSRLYQWCKSMGDSAFFAYALHSVVIIGMVRGFLYLIPIIGSNPWGKMAIIPIWASLTMALCYVAYRLLFWVSPRALSYLTGGRV